MAINTLPFPFFTPFSMETYYNIGDEVVVGQTKAKLVEFIGYKLAKHPSEKGKHRITLKERKDYKADKQWNTEQWIAITDNGTTVKASVLVPKQHRNLFSFDESVLHGTDRTSVINTHVVDPITCSYDECQTGVFNMYNYKKREDFLWEKHEQLCTTIFLFEKYLATQTRLAAMALKKRYKGISEIEYRAVQIYAAMTRHQLIYPTIEGHNKIWRFMKNNINVRELYNNLFDEFSKDFKYEKTDRTKRSSKELVDSEV